MMIDILQLAKRRLREMVSGSSSVEEAYTRAQGYYTSLTDADGIFRRVTDEYAAFLGYHPSELLGQHFTVVVTPRHHAISLIEQECFVKDSLQHTHFVYYLRHKQGHELPVTVDGVLITDEDGIRHKLAIIYPVSLGSED